MNNMSEGSKESTNDSIDNTIDKHYYNNNTVYLTGGGIAMMQGGVDFREAFGHNYKCKPACNAIFENAQLCFGIFCGVLCAI